MSSSTKADVLIIGAGASGAVVAKELSARGFGVVCLEQGRWVNPSEFAAERLEWELQAWKQWHHDPNVRANAEDYPCEVSEAEVLPQMFAGVGGSTLHFGGHWMRMTPSDFRVRTLDGVADDWPISYEELAPYYDRVDVDFAVSGMGGDPAYPPSAAPPLPPHPLGKLGRRAAKGMNALGWHWWPAPNAIASRPYGRLSQCQRLGACETGCPAGAKASTDITHWPDALANGARVVTGARVRELTTNERGLATGATWIDRNGGEHHQEAGVVILACNAIGTARLLLLSASARFPDGLANSSGLVGKRLMLHPYGTVIGLYDEPLDSWLGPAGQPIHSMQFYETDASRGFVRGAKWQVMPTFGPLSILVRYSEWPREYGASLHQVVREGIGRALDWGAITEDLPDPDNSVTLDPGLTDSDGVPAPRVRYRISDNTRRLLHWHLARLQEVHEASGAIRTVETELVPDQPGHLLGTARMGDDPATSVVDQFGRCHDVPNLFIVDGSIFVTAGGVNPTATICALALRCGEHLAENAGLQGVP
jgi:choline dehydrogenase-like flavoprotein